MNYSYGLHIVPFTFEGVTEYYVLDSRPYESLKYLTATPGNPSWTESQSEATSLPLDRAQQWVSRLLKNYSIGNLTIRQVATGAGTRYEIIFSDSVVFLYLSGITFQDYYNGYQHATSLWTSLGDDAVRLRSIEDANKALYQIIRKTIPSET